MSLVPISSKILHPWPGLSLVLRYKQEDLDTEAFMQDLKTCLPDTWEEDLVHIRKLYAEAAEEA